MSFGVSCVRALSWALVAGLLAFYASQTLTIDGWNVVSQNYDIHFVDGKGQPSSCEGILWTRDGRFLHEVATDETGAIRGWNWSSVELRVQCQHVEWTIPIMFFAGIGYVYDTEGMVHLADGATFLDQAQGGSPPPPEVETVPELPLEDSGSCGSCDTPSMPPPSEIPPAPQVPADTTPELPDEPANIDYAGWRAQWALRVNLPDPRDRAVDLELTEQCSEPVRLVGTPTIETPVATSEIPPHAADPDFAVAAVAAGTPVGTPEFTPTPVSFCGA